MPLYLGRAFAASNRFSQALPEFEAATKVTGGRDPAILQILAAMYSELGKYQHAVTIAQQALELSEKEQNSDLATDLHANLDRYRHQAQNASGSQSAPQTVIHRAHLVDR